MLFRQLFDAETSSYTYVIADEATREAALVDTVLEQVDRDLTILRELDLRLVYVLDTHTHADHVTGAGRLRAETGATTVAGPGGAPCVDRKVADGDVIHLGTTRIVAIATPGHTDESVSYLVEDRVLTGDALLIRAAGRTDFQNGNAAALYDSITTKLFTLADDTLVYPGHDYKGHTVSTIGEEKRWNPRIAGKSKEEFIAIMGSLGLPEPSRIREAVPANLACGRVAAEVQG
jgi:glyoxylase-like metal-dependent hydrolase (beta-lactamase superfamily II)